jgi:septal ring-binding cell division protein DamX
MPDLNLIDEGGFDDVPEAPATPPAKKSVKSSSGGGGKTILLLVVCLCILAAAVYFLNRRGIIKLWGKKQQPIAQVQEEQFPPETTSQPAQVQKQADTNEVALLDTAPVEEKAEAGKQPEAVKEPEAVSEPKANAAKPSAKKSKSGKKNEAVIETESSSKLNEMKGEFTVQVIAYREKSRAEETAKNLEFSGYPSFVEKIPMKGGDWYTVRIGRYASRDEAKKAVQSFAEQLQAHYVIDKIRLK